MASMAGNPRYSIVLPTRNRGHLLRMALGAALAIEYDDFEIVVSTNACTDDSDEIVRAADDPRIQHVSPDRSLSMTEHWDFALGHATGDWVVFLCDDDAPLPDMLVRADAILAQADEYDAVVFRMARYMHPQTLPGLSPNSLIVRAPRVGWHVPDQERMLLDITCGASPGDVPKMLNSFVRQRAIQAVRERMGCCFPPSCPDYSFAAGFMLCGFNYVNHDDVLGLWGYGQDSIGASSMTGQGSNTADFVKEFGGDPIPYSKVKVDLIPAHVSSSVLGAARLCGVELPLDLVEYYCHLIRSVRYQEYFTGRSPHRDAVFQALAEEDSLTRQRVRTRLATDGMRIRWPHEPVPERIWRFSRRLRHEVRCLTGKHSWLGKLKRAIQPGSSVWDDDERCVPGDEHEFRDIAEAAERYRGLEHALFPAPAPEAPVRGRTRQTPMAPDATLQ